MDLDIFPALSVFTNLNAISFRWILSAQVNEYSERQIYFLPPPPPFFSRNNTRFENKFRENWTRTLLLIDL